MRTNLMKSPFGFLLDEPESLNEIPASGSEDEWFHQAIREAHRSIGRTYPNPPVGSVIVKNNQIIGKGSTSPAGDAHAEINALRDAGEAARGATLLTTLEPCSHFGRTPPCAEAIIRSGISKVIIGIQDPNPMVNGNGMRCLAQAGIEVQLRKHDALNAKADALIRPFAKNISHKLPWVICKVAASLDGCVTTEKGKATHISGEKARLLTHRLRNYVDAVLVGSTTVDIDDPLLTVRHSGLDSARNPNRIVLDGALKTSVSAKVYDQKYAPTWVIHTEQASKTRRHEFDVAKIQRIEIPSRENHVSLSQALQKIAQLGMTSVLVECGSQLLTQFLKEGLLDELWWIVSPKIAGSAGLNAITGEISFADSIQIEWSDPVVLGEDVLFVGRLRG